MSKFFGSESQIDESVVRTHDDYFNATSHAAPQDENGGVSNEAFLNDYRNRKPFHYIESGTDGYYYWQYGATMEIEFEISDEVAFTDPTPEFVVDVRVNGVSVVDKDTGVANLELGSMAKENAEDYYTAEQTEEIVGRVGAMAEIAKQEAEEANRRASKMTVDLYSMIGQNPGASDNYTVMADIPFTAVLKPEQKEITVNGTLFKSILCVDASNPKVHLDFPIEDLPHEVPFTAIYNTSEEEPRLLTGLSILPPLYLAETVVPYLEKNLIITTRNLRLSEEGDEDEENKQEGDN